jgi:hypothetical protein
LTDLLFFQLQTMAEDQLLILYDHRQEAFNDKEVWQQLIFTTK